MLIRMEERKIEKMKQWYKEHKIEIFNVMKLGFYIATIISIPFLAIIFALANSTDKVLPSQGLFTGFIAYCGIIISFLGIYWKTTREEEKARREKEEKIKNEIVGIQGLFKYIIKKNRDSYKYKFSTDGFIQKLYQRRGTRNQNWFYILDDEVVKKEKKLIVSQGEKAYCLIELHNEMKDFNSKVEIYKEKISMTVIKEKCEKYLNSIYDNKVFFELVLNELELIDTLLETDSHVNKYKLSRSIELLEKFLGSKNFMIENKYFELFNKTFDCSNRLINASDRVGFLREVLIYSKDKGIITEYNLNHIEVFDLIDRYVRDLFIFNAIATKIIDRFEEVEEYLSTIK